MYDFRLDKDRFGSELGNNLPSRSMVYIEGDNGTGKSVICQRLSYAFCKKGHRVSYVTTQYDTTDYISQMESISYDITDYLITHKLLNFKPVEMEKVPDEVQAIDIIDDNEDIWSSDIIIVDPIDMIITDDSALQQMDEESLNEKLREFIDSMKNKLREYDCTVVLTANPSNLSPAELRPFRNSSNIYIKTGEKNQSGETLNMISVVRHQMKDKSFNSEILFRVEAGYGITIDSRSLV